VILGAKRTPFGKFGGALHSLSAVRLGGHAIAAALAQAEMSGEEVDELIMGMVLQGGSGQIPSRQAARHGGLDWNVPTETVNKVCASGMRSITLADQLIRLGDNGVVVAGGMESMSQAPYVLPSARWGQRMGDGELIDLMIHDGLQCPFDSVHMAVHGNRCAEAHGISREQQDEWALRSHRLAISARSALEEEIVPVRTDRSKSIAETITQDETPREDTSLQRLSELRPVFQSDGTITAGNAPGLNDGAAALVLSSASRAREHGAQPLAAIVGHAQVGVEASRFPETPGLAIRKLMYQAGLGEKDVLLFEINEAFASVALIACIACGLPENKVNVNGGAVALGHPIGASGARIVLTLAYELRRRGGGLGVAAICSGSGQGDAVLLRVD
jgi:acetyl-CoA C-acetyltransferase